MKQEKKKPNTNNNKYKRKSNSFIHLSVNLDLYMFVRMYTVYKTPYSHKRYMILVFIFFVLLSPSSAPTTTLKCYNLTFHHCMILCFYSSPFCSSSFSTSSFHNVVFVEQTPSIQTNKKKCICIKTTGEKRNRQQQTQVKNLHSTLFYCITSNISRETYSINTKSNNRIYTYKHTGTYP